PLSPFSSHYSAHHRHLHSFPTRRSSDLTPPIVQPLLKPRPPGAQARLDTGRRHGGDRREVARGLGHRCAAAHAAAASTAARFSRSEEHTSELQSPYDLVCRLLLEKKKTS